MVCLILYNDDDDDDSVKKKEKKKKERKKKHNLVPVWLPLFFIVVIRVCGNGDKYHGVLAATDELYVRGTKIWT